MTFPNSPDKQNEEALFTAVDLLSHRRRMGTAVTITPPQAAIFCYQPDLFRYAVKKQRGQKVKGFFGDFYLLKKTGSRIGVAGNFGVGAPVTAVLLEDLVAFGVRQFALVGMAGGLQESLSAGDLVVADRAIRDEGTSHHYLPAAKYASASTSLTSRLQQTLDANNLPYTTGTSWTTDAPYRETRREVSQYQQEGVLTVEMETAAFFAVAQYLNVSACAAFAIGDAITNGKWHLDFDARRTNRALETLFDAVLHLSTYVPPV